MVYRIVHREWRTRKRFIYVPMLAELGATVALLVLFGLAQPDLYRTDLWKAGSDLNFNSSPNVIIFALVNNDPVPQVPFVWNEMLTNFNVAISVMSLFLMLTKLVGVIMHIWFPILNTFFYMAMTALYATSVYGQAGPDYLDPNHPSSVAWYIAKPCTVAANTRIQKSCKMAKGTFAATAFMLGVCVYFLALGIYSMLPNELNDKPHDSDDEESPSVFKKKDKTWEMSPIPPTPRTGTMPFTPRTMAFNTLERKLPLRQ